jgi:hypothetical protein
VPSILLDDDDVFAPSSENGSLDTGDDLDIPDFLKG